MKKITINKVELEVPDNVVDELIERYGENNNSPRMKEEYLYHISNGYLDIETWSNNPLLNGLLAIGNCFWGDDKKLQAEARFQRLKADAKAQFIEMPEEGAEYWYWCFRTKTAKTWYFNDYINFLDLLMGNVHKTKEDAEEYGRTLAAGYQFLVDKARERRDSK